MADLETVTPIPTERGTYIVEMTLDQLKEMKYCLTLVARQRRTSREYANKKKEEVKQAKLEKIASGYVKKYKEPFSVILPLGPPISPTIPPLPTTKSIPIKIPSPTLKVIN